MSKFCYLSESKQFRTDVVNRLVYLLARLKGVDGSGVYGRLVTNFPQASSWMSQDLLNRKSAPRALNKNNNTMAEYLFCE